MRRIILLMTWSWGKWFFHSRFDGTICMGCGVPFSRCDNSQYKSTIASHVHDECQCNRIDVKYLMIFDENMLLHFEIYRKSKLDPQNVKNSYK